MVNTKQDWSWAHVGKRIRAKRLQLGMTQVALAESAHLVQSAVAHLERGTYNPQIDTLRAVATALHCSLTEIVCGSQAAPTDAVQTVLQQTRAILESADGSAIALIKNAVDAAQELLKRRRGSKRHPTKGQPAKRQKQGTCKPVNQAASPQAGGSTGVSGDFLPADVWSEEQRED